MNTVNFVSETTEYDKKQAVEHRKMKSWLRSVSAFANTAGGTLVFGITDEDEIIGLDDIKSDSEFVSQKIKERISPFPEVVMKTYRTEDGKDLLILGIPNGKETPYYYTGDGVTEAFIRIGNESVVANATELKRLVLRGKNSSYDSLISEYRFEDFSFTKLRERYRSWTGSSLTEKIMESFGLYNDEGYLTNAGVLLADDSPVRWSRVFCTRWNGLDKSGGQLDALDSAEYVGSLLILLTDSMRFVKCNTRTLWKKTPDSRIEMPDYCERSVYEALVNALIHRDYMINGSEVHVDMFDDRLEIYSPGGMPDGTRIQERDITQIPSTRRNPVLADIFSRLGHMERQGSGLEKIRLAYENAVQYTLDKEPRFRSGRADFTVILPNLNYGYDALNDLDGALNGALNCSDDALNGALNYSDDALNYIKDTMLELLKEEPGLTQSEMARRLNTSRRTVQRIIKELYINGYLSRSGSKKTGQWVVHDKS